VKRFLTSRWFLITVSVYAVLWLATYIVGARQVRDLTLAELQVDPSFRQVPLETEHLSGFPLYGYRIVSYAPFVLTVRWMVWWDSEGAAGGTANYFWLGVPTRRPWRVYDWAV
jgi:hypothetical protein